MYFSCFLPQEDPQLQGLLNDITFTPPGSDWFSETQQELGLDLPSHSGFNNYYGSMQFQDGVDTSDFVDSLIVDPDENHCEGLTGQGSSAVDGWNLNKGYVSRLSARPKGPVKGVYGKGGGSISNTDTAVLQGSIWNWPVGMNKKGSFSSSETASASHEPSSLPGYLVNLLVRGYTLVCGSYCSHCARHQCKGLKAFA